MKFLSYIFILVFLITQIQAQQLVLEAPLDSNVSESSGLIYLNNTLITHNDSGGNNELYDIDISTGNSITYNSPSPSVKKIKTRVFNLNNSI